VHQDNTTILLNKRLAKMIAPRVLTLLSIKLVVHFVQKAMKFMMMILVNVTFAVGRNIKIKKILKILNARLVLLIPTSRMIASCLLLMKSGVIALIVLLVHLPKPATVCVNLAQPAKNRKIQNVLVAMLDNIVIVNLRVFNVHWVNFR